MPKRKPSQPRQLSQDKQERLEEIRRLKAQGASVTLDRGGRIVSAYRSNVFNLLLQRGSITQNHHDAAYRFCQEWAAWKGLDGGGNPSAEKVDNGGSAGSKALVTDHMIRAGRQVTRFLSELDPAQQDLLIALTVATVEEDRPMMWRGIVERVTGETVRDKQTKMVVACLQALTKATEAPKAQNRVAA